jgi:hypothetical protein
VGKRSLVAGASKTSAIEVSRRERPLELRQREPTTGILPAPNVKALGADAMTSTLEAVKEFHSRGWMPIPIPRGEKRPALNSWQLLRMRADEIPRYFPNGQNVGLLLGEPSGGLIDVDLDCLEAIALADEFLPATGMESGRPGAPRSHRWYRVNPAPKTQRYADPTRGSNGGERATIIELRSSGAQTLVPPSYHPSGEQYEWYKQGEPTTIAQEPLLNGVRRTATCSLVSQYWNDGKRHDLALALAGTLLRARWSLPDTEHFITTAARVAGDSEIEDRRQAIRSTAEQLKKGQPATGRSRLAELLPKDVAERVFKWLGLQDRSFNVVGERTIRPDAFCDWPDPRPLPDGLLPVPVLEDPLVPDALRPWLADIAERLQVPIEFPATAAIVGLSSVVGNQVRIRPKRRDDWTVTPNLWGAVIGRPGVMKSPAISEAMKPLYRLEQQFQIGHMEIVKRQEFDREAAQARKVALREQMKKAAKNGDNLDIFREQFCEDEQNESRPRRFIVNDATVEKYGELLNENPCGLLLFRDELTGWLRSLDDERRVNDRAFFLESWAGDGNYTYDRIGRGTLRIDNTTTSILGGIQPGPLESYLRNALGYGEGDDGLMQRFQVIVYPDIISDWRNVDRWPETEAKDRAFSIYKDLSELAVQTLTAEPSDEGGPFLRLAVDAQELFDDWFAGLNRALRSGEFEHPALEAHFSKYKSLMPSLALIFHLCDMADGKQAGPVSLTATERAAAWCDFLMRHAERIYGLGLRSTAIHARTLAGHLKKRDLPDPFTARELYRKGWAGLGTAKAVEEPLGLLEDLGWLRCVQMPADLGRPTVHYLINPRIGGRQQ